MTPTTHSSRFSPNPMPCGRTRREFLWEVGGGFAGLALIDLLSRQGFFPGVAAAEAAYDKTAKGSAIPAGSHVLAPKPSHFPAKAKHVVFLFMNGAPESG